MSKYDTFDRWKAEQLQRILDTTDPPAASLAPEALLPTGEEMAPEAPTAVVARYRALLSRCMALAAQQAAYDKERAALDARGTALVAAWETIRTEHAACVAALDALNLPLDAVLRALWQEEQATRTTPEGIPEALWQWLHQTKGEEV